MEEEININKVAEDLAKKDFIVFAGTGVSEPAGVKDWRGLLQALNAKFPVAGVNIDELLERNYPSYAQMFYGDFKNDDNIDGYFNSIAEELKPTKSPYSALQLQIFYTTGCIITTNFERLTFENAYQVFRERENIQEDCQNQTLPDICEEHLKRGFNVTYLHGTIDKKNIVFTTTDYFKAYELETEGANARALEFMRKIYGKHTIVFVGFSFLDKYLSDALRKIHGELEVDDAIDTRAIFDAKGRPRGPTYRHYAFLQAGQNTTEQEKKLDDNLRAMSIGVVRYKEHPDVAKWFQTIERFKRPTSLE